MKYLFLSFLVVLTLSCSEENPMVDPEEEDEEEEVVLLCENDAFQLTIVANGITMNSDSCWFLFHENPESAGLSSDYPAVIKWEYPGYPEWNGANSLTFYYQTETVESDKEYQAENLIGVIEFDGSGGTMFTSLGSEVLTVQVDEFSMANNYVCGTFAGKAIVQDDLAVELTGSFKGRLAPN